ncbi:hypothetical protein JXB12_01175 [candidate division KSB1 bacterium]|nr:hypothetical protein [candidate division KSB1 bacterium]
MKCLHWVAILLLMLCMSISVFSETLAQELNEENAPPEVKETLAKLREEIQTEELTFNVGYNYAHQFTIAQLCGLRETDTWWTEAKDINIGKIEPQSLEMRAEAEAVGLPQVWDWRANNGVTSVKDQQSCGSCWAFSAIASFESNLLIEQNINVDLSEQHLVSCNPWGWGCDGGWWPHDMLKNPGAVLESEFPYAAADLPCASSYNYVYQLGGWAYVDGDDKVPSVDKIKQAVYDYGPVSASVYVGSAFQSYTGGVFNKNEAPKKGFLDCSEPAKVNHAILIVGWDESKDAWIIKNSWSRYWGENGYMYIKYGVSNIGYGSVVVY